MIRPLPVSTRNMRPGSSRPLRDDGRGVDVEHAGLAARSTTRPSSVTQYRPGRRPLRSSTAPMSVPSVNVIAAGPSHGSMSVEWYS